jgi:putative flippase GtrA
MISKILRYATTHRWQIIRFGLVGLTTLALNYLLVWIFFARLELNYRVAVTCAYVLTVITHFFLNRSFTYQQKNRSVAPHTARYSVMLLVNYLIMLAVVSATVDLIGLTPYHGIIFSVSFTAFSSFFLMKYFVFPHKENA